MLGITNYNKNGAIYFLDSVLVKTDGKMKGLLTGKAEMIKAEMIKAKMINEKCYMK